METNQHYSIFEDKTIIVALPFNKKVTQLDLKIKRRQIQRKLALTSHIVNFEKNNLKFYKQRT